MFSRENIEYKTDDQIRAMRRAGLVVADIHQALREAAAPGMTTMDLDDVAAGVLKRHGAVSNFLGYHGFPGHICASVNEEVVHGIPGSRTLHDGDVVSLDCGAVVDGWHADAAITVIVGQASQADQQLSDTTRQAMWDGVAALAQGSVLAAVGEAVEDRVDEVAATSGHRYGIVHEFIGHGIGSAMHQAPEVFNTRVRQRRIRLKAGLCVCVEPLLTQGDPTVEVLDDDWTVVTLDGSYSAHWEHTVAATAKGPRILTPRK